MLRTACYAGVFCSRTCGVESDPTAKHCSVCGRVIEGGEYLMSPDGSPRHAQCRVKCDVCGKMTHQPVYFKAVPVRRVVYSIMCRRVMSVYSTAGRDDDVDILLLC